jgi:hypothetical protein
MDPKVTRPAPPAAGPGLRAVRAVVFAAVVVALALAAHLAGGSERPSGWHLVAATVAVAEMAVLPNGAPPQPDERCGG